MAVLFILVALCIGLLMEMLMRARRFVPPEEKTVEPLPVDVDEEGIASRMQALIRVKTVSYRDKSLEDDAPFEAFPALLETLYPAVHKVCTVERTGPRGLLYCWKGKESRAPSVLMSHYDVVPVQESMWTKPPFAGVIEDGVLWGRGTLDTKGTLLGIFEAAEALIQKGFVPAQDIYFAFGGDEEISGMGAPGNVEALRSRGITPAFVLDEGGAVVDGVFPGVRRSTAVVGTGEKGVLSVRLSVESAGGHASAPPPHTPVGQLAKAVTRVEASPFPFRLTKPASAMFDTLGRHSTRVYKVMFANLWITAPLLNMLCKKMGGEMNALVRTTCAFTQMEGSDAINVLPPRASVSANLRLLEGDDAQSAVKRLSDTIADPDIAIETIQATEASPASRTDGEPWDRLKAAIEATWDGAIVASYLMVAASDARHFAKISDCVYRFSAMALSKEERGLIHSNDERVPLAKLYEVVRFYTRLMQES